MKRLTENLIQQRLKSCTTDLDKVLQINVTGRDLEDVSLLQKMTGVEILSFSVNSITSLAEFRFCKNLKELYLRNNKISDLGQISYLKNLPKLKLLTLIENPCTKDPMYRMTVIKNLKHLTELDGIAIKAEERRQAEKLGREVFSEDEEKIHFEKLNNKASNQNVSKLKNSEENLAELVDLRELKETREAREVKELKEFKDPREIESKETKEPKESIDLKELKEIKLVIDKLTTENNPRDFTLTENVEQNLCLSSGSENEKSEKGSSTNIHMKLNSLRPTYCRYCGRKEQPKLKNIPKNYNLLSATINLVKELDYSCLQIVSAEINSRLNYYEMDIQQKSKFDSFEHIK